MSERDRVGFGGSTIEYEIVRSRRRRKTIEISLDHGSGVRVMVPLDASPGYIRQVVLKRADWIVRRSSEQAKLPKRRSLVGGESLPYLGREIRLHVEPTSARRASLKFESGCLHVKVPVHLDGEQRRSTIEAALVRWYRERAQETLAARTEVWSKRVGRKPSGILIRDQRRRWGSCSTDGTIRYNWRLVMAPPALLDYVVVHELVHLRVRNHSPVFWAEVTKLMPDCKERRAALKAASARLVI